MVDSMATPIQENLIHRNQEYAANFKDGHLDLPPAKKYAVGRLPEAFSRSSREN